MNFSNSNFVFMILTSLFLTISSYCSIPFILRLKNGKYEYKKGKKILIINSAAVCFIYFIFYLIKPNMFYKFNILPAIFYYYINKLILLNSNNNIIPEQSKPQPSNSLSSNNNSIDFIKTSFHEKESTINFEDKSSKVNNSLSANSLKNSKSKSFSSKEKNKF